MFVLAFAFVVFVVCGLELDESEVICGTGGQCGGTDDQASSCLTSTCITSGQGITINPISLDVYFSESSHTVRRIGKNFTVYEFGGKYGVGDDVVNVPITSARFRNPKGMVARFSRESSLMELFIADTGNAKIKRVRIDGITNRVTTYAGNGVEKEGIVNGLATKSQLGSPNYMVFYTTRMYGTYRTGIFRLDLTTQVLSEVVRGRGALFGGLRIFRNKFFTHAQMGLGPRIFSGSVVLGTVNETLLDKPPFSVIINMGYACATKSFYILGDSQVFRTRDPTTMSSIAPVAVLGNGRQVLASLGPMKATKMPITTPSDSFTNGSVLWLIDKSSRVIQFKIATPTSENGDGCEYSETLTRSNTLATSRNGVASGQIKTFMSRPTLTCTQSDPSVTPVESMCVQNPTGVIFDRLRSALYVTDETSIRSITRTGLNATGVYFLGLYNSRGDNLHLNARFSTLGGLLIVQDILYISDSGNNRVKSTRLSMLDVSLYACSGQKGDTSNVFRTLILCTTPMFLARYGSRFYIGVLQGIKVVEIVSGATQTFVPPVRSSGGSNTPGGIAMYKGRGYTHILKVGQVLQINLISGVMQSFLGSAVLYGNSNKKGFELFGPLSNLMMDCERKVLLLFEGDLSSEPNNGHLIKKYDLLRGNVSWEAGSGDGSVYNGPGPLHRTEFNLREMTAAAFGFENDIFITDATNGRVYVYNAGNFEGDKNCHVTSLISYTKSRSRDFRSKSFTTFTKRKTHTGSNSKSVERSNSIVGGSKTKDVHDTSTKTFSLSKDVEPPPETLFLVEETNTLNYVLTVLLPLLAMYTNTADIIAQQSMMLLVQSSTCFPAIKLGQEPQFLLSVYDISIQGSWALGTIVLHLILVVVLTIAYVIIINLAKYADLRLYFVLKVSCMLHAGIVVNAATILINGDPFIAATTSNNDQVIGFTVFVATTVLLVILLHRNATAAKKLPGVTFKLYSKKKRYYSWQMPVGAWGPKNYDVMFAPFVRNIVVSRVPLWSPVPNLSIAILSLLAAIQPTTTTGCDAQMIALFLVFFVLGIVHLFVLKPYRWIFSNRFYGIMYTLCAAACIVAVTHDAYFLIPYFMFIRSVFAIAHLGWLCLVMVMEKYFWYEKLWDDYDDDEDEEEEEEEEEEVNQKEVKQKEMEMPLLNKTELSPKEKRVRKVELIEIEPITSAVSPQSPPTSEIQSQQQVDTCHQETSSPNTRQIENDTATTAIRVTSESPHPPTTPSMNFYTQLLLSVPGGRGGPRRSLQTEEKPIPLPEAIRSMIEHHHLTLHPATPKVVTTEDRTSSVPIQPEIPQQPDIPPHVSSPTPLAIESNNDSSVVQVQSPTLPLHLQTLAQQHGVVLVSGSGETKELEERRALSRSLFGGGRSDGGGGRTPSSSVHSQHTLI